MGYRRNATRLRLEYDDTSPYPGLEIVARSASLDQLMTIADLVEQAGEGDAVDRDKIAVIRALCDSFADRLIEWNFEDEEGQPLPASAEVLRGEEPQFVLRLVRDWLDAVQGVSPPLPNGSASGESNTPPGSPPVDLPMDPLPAGQPS